MVAGAAGFEPATFGVFSALHYSVSCPLKLPPMNRVLCQKNNLNYGPIIGGQVTQKNLIHGPIIWGRSFILCAQNILNICLYIEHLENFAKPNIVFAGI